MKIFGIDPKSCTVLGVYYRSQTVSELEIVEMFKAIHIASNDQTVITGELGIKKLSIS